MLSKSLAITIAAIFGLCGVCHAGPLAPFGTASAYNLFALGTVDSHGNTILPGTVGTQADVTGRIAAAAQVTQGTTIGSSLGSDPWGSLAPYDLVSPNGLVGSQNFNINSHGNAYAPGSNGHINFNGGGHRVTTGGSGIDFDGLRTYLDSYTTFLSGLTANGSVGGNDPHNPQNLLLSGTSSTLNVFDITAAQFGGNSSLDIIVPVGSTVLVNVSGSSLSLQRALLNNGNQISGDSDADDRFLFNFSQATSVQIDAQFNSSVLAPFAVLSGGSQMGGNFIAAQIGNTGEVHNPEFIGNLPPLTGTPEPGSWILFSSGLAGLAGVIRRKLKA